MWNLLFGKMARLVWSKNGDLAVVTTSKLKILSYRDGRTKLSHAVSTDETQNENSEDKDNQQTCEGSALGQCLLCCFSTSGSLFALCCNDKTLVIWNVETQECLSTRNITKRATAIAFDHKEECVVVADKGGDVYSFSVKTQEPGTLILGHVSMILDMVITRDDKFIITADRDEKIRISHYPNSYNIECYCLGHTDFVSSLVLLSPTTNSDLLVSASGDGSVRFWDYRQGKSVHNMDIDLSETENTTKSENPSLTVRCLACCQKNKVAAASFEKSCHIFLCHINEDNTVRKLPVLECDAPPWHISFDPEGRMWTTQHYPNDPVIVFEPQSALENKLPLKYCRARNQFPLLQAANEWSFLKECVGSEANLSLLRKKEFDNVADYLARKEQRLKSKNPAQSCGKTNCNTNPTNKKHQAKRAKLQT